MHIEEESGGTSVCCHRYDAQKSGVVKTVVRGPAWRGNVDVAASSLRVMVAIVNRRAMGSKGGITRVEVASDQ